MRALWARALAERALGKRALWAGAFAALLALSFPFRAGELRFDVGLFAGWLVLAPLVLLLEGLSPRRAFLWATASATAGYAAILFWLYVVVVVHGHAPAPVGVAAVVAVALVLGAHVGLGAALARWLEPVAGRAAVLVLPAAWVAAEHLRGFDLFGGFPWAYLGYAAHRDGPILQLAGWGGVWGLSLLLAVVGTLAGRGRLRAAVAVLAVAHGLGFAQRLVAGDPPAPELRVQLVQGSIPQDQKWDPDLALRNFRVHLELSRLAPPDTDLVLWPEAAVPILLEHQPEARAAVSALARDSGAVVVVGGVGFEWPHGAPQPRYFNSVFAFGPDGAPRDRYDKTHLVPFGEYVPLRSVLGFLSGLATGLAQGDLTPGERPRVLRTPAPLVGDHAPAALICYEVIYPALVREAVRDGARLLLNLTNDAWYGRTSAPHQFLAIAAMRSAEHGVPMLRAANTGVSGVIDAGGTVREQTPIFERRALATLVPRARAGPTPYTRLGDWVIAGCWLLLVAVGGFRIVRRHELENTGDPGRASGSGRARPGAAEASLTSPGSERDSTS